MLIDVIIPLGAQNDSEGNLSPMAISRLKGAMRVYREYPGSKLPLHGGHGRFNDAKEPHSHYAERFLIERGVSPNDILAKLNTTNAVEEAAITKRYLQHYQISSIFVVTSKGHVRRAKFIFEHFFEPSMLV